MLIIAHDGLRDFAVEAVGQLTDGHRIAPLEQLPGIPAQRTFEGLARLATLCREHFQTQGITERALFTASTWTTTLTGLEWH